ncbi:general substrate transporter [Amylocarpus encephaloides]|uniref:General substrate transporter n=1 Tax=Amylocarpus encephaloides TaxID=45428 RepID=A0A9P8C4J9_9HELO|nr:general substrate transporter [Amylocarpus encephaloides]
MEDYSDEKLEAQQIERTISDAGDSHGFTPEQQRKIIHRIDRRLVTTLGVLYMCSLMDRTNLGAANIAGMAKDLKLIENRYSIIVLIFFLPYVLFQPPATVILRKMGPRIFLTAIVILWGGCMIGFGFVKGWEQMVGLRVLLGVLEAGFFPGCAYLLSCWYTRYELQKRNAVFYLIGSMASACSGIMAYGIMQMDGLAKLAGWRWIFIIEGLITCLLGIGGYFLIVDFPELAASSWKFLNPQETAFVVARIEADRSDAIPEKFSIKEYMKNALDLKVWAFASCFGLTTTCSYAIAYFLPVILMRGMGFSIAAAQCLVAPPYVAAGIYMYGMAWLGDKYHTRGPIVAFNALLGLIGLPLLGYSKSNSVRYFGVFLATISANANVPSILTYQANNIRGQWKRALCSATLVGFGGVGGILGSTVFRQQDSPEYGPGIMTAMIANGLVIVIVGLLSVKFHLANKRADNGGKIIEGQIGFRYTL